MLAFVTTIRHPRNCRSYERVGRLLDATLKSICRQTSDDFVVIVVHNRRPDVSIADSRIRYVHVDWPAPSDEASPHIGWNAFTLDKGTKCAIGVALARQFEPDHVMFVDADDLIHHSLAELSNNYPTHPGWYSPRGLIHTAGSRHVHDVTSGFHLKNGSTAVVRVDLIDVPAELQPSSGQREILESMGADEVSSLLGQHGHWQDLASARGEQMEALPFPSAIWMIGTGENHSGNLRSGRSRRAIDELVTSTYGLERPTVKTAIAATASTYRRRLQRRLAGN